MERQTNDSAPVVSQFQPVLGTTLEVRTVVDVGGSADAVEQSVLAEVDRLEAIFSIYVETSELSRWCSGDDVEPSEELATVLDAAERWFERSNGAYNPMIGVAMACWRAAAGAGVRPDAPVLRSIADTIASLPYAVRGGHVRREGDCRGIDLNAAAKGYIVDRALLAGRAEPSLVDLTVNLGGDLAHCGPGALLVGIEDPMQPYDNVPPLLHVEVRGRALATSGSARRGFRIGDEWIGHVLDPRTCEPVAHTRAVSVLAHDAMTADFVATIVGVLGPREGLVFADALGSVGACVIDEYGDLFRNDAWREQERTR